MTPKQYYLTLTGLHSKLPLFFRPWWLDMASNNWDIAVSEENGEVHGLWPYCMEKKLGVLILRNPSVTPYLGPLILQDGKIIFSDEKTNHEKTVQAIFTSLPEYGSFDAETTIHFNNKKFFAEKGYNVISKLTYELSLQPPADLLFKGFHNNHRKLIRLATECNTIEEGLTHIDSFFFLHEKTYARKGKKYHYDPEYLTKIITTSVKENAGQMFTAVDTDNQPVAFLFTVWDNERMYLLLSAVNTSTAHAGAGRLLIWHAIQLAKQKGLLFFDFEGSMDERVGNIYKRFGGERKTYLCISKTHSFIWKMKKKLLG